MKTTAAAHPALFEDEGVESRSYEDGSCIETSSGNKVSRQSVLCGTSNIRLHGKAIVHRGAIIRGDLATVRLGRYCVIDEEAVIRPPFQRRKGAFSFVPLTIGDNVYIGKGCVIQAAAIGSNVHVGAGAIISRRCILKDCCRIEAGTVLAPDTIVPPFAIFAGTPGRLVGELPVDLPRQARALAEARYRGFAPQSKAWLLRGPPGAAANPAGWVQSVRLRYGLLVLFELFRAFASGRRAGSCKLLPEDDETRQLLDDSAAVVVAAAFQALSSSAPRAMRQIVRFL